MHDLRVENDRQNAVLEAVAIKDVGKTGGYHRAYAVIEERPDRMLATRAATEIVAREQNFRTCVAGVVQREIRSRLPRGNVLSGLAVVEVPPFVEQVHTVPCAAD